MLETIKRIVREPIVIFILSGSLVFIIYQKSLNYYSDQNREIVVTQAELDFAAETFKKTWNRSPTIEERQKLVESHIKNEIYYREAIALGLDKSDQAIKRRLRQVMELLMDDFAAVYPSESQLQEYLSSNAVLFRSAPTISFTHWFYAFEEKQKAIDDLAEITDQPTSKIAKDRIMKMIPSKLSNVKEYEIERIFGAEFSKVVFNQNPGSWEGPIESAYGWHLVKLDSLGEGVLPPLTEIWDEVQREWSATRKKELMEEHYERMKSKYHVVLEMSDGPR